MAIPEYFCKRCERKVKIHQTPTCADGRQHEVEAKTYYSPMPSLTCIVEPERKEISEGGMTRVVSCRSVEFNGGKFTTTNPFDQRFFDQLEREGGLITLDQWRKQYIGAEKLLAIKERELAERENKIKEQENALLAQLKEQGEEKKA